jgi:cadmium resistance transport/sequestration family protein
MELVLTSILAFTSTNIDDIFLLILYFSSRKYTDVNIITGQYLGLLALIAISFIGSLSELILDPRYIGLLGLIPIYLGIKELIGNKKEDGNIKLSNKRFRSPVLAIALVTFANGGDNIGIYIPLFVSLSLWQRLIMISIFLMLVMVWCLVAKYLTRHPLMQKTIAKYGHILTPYILILLGIYILYENQAMKVFWSG